MKWTITSSTTPTILITVRTARIIIRTTIRIRTETTIRTRITTRTRTRITRTIITKALRIGAPERGVPIYIFLKKLYTKTVKKRSGRGEPAMEREEAHAKI